MNKLMIIVIMATMFCGCNDNQIKTTKGTNIGSIEKIEFEGHAYLVRNGYRRGGICHDENCKCKVSKQ